MEVILMNNLFVKHHPVKNEFSYTYDTYLKLLYISYIQDEYLFKRLYHLVKQSNFLPHIKKYLLDYYFLGKSNVKLNRTEKNLLEWLQEYFELYLYHNDDKYCSFILAEITYNSLYNPLLISNDAVKKRLNK